MLTDPISLVKEPVRRQKVYTLPKIDYDIKVNQNENPYDLPEAVKNDILAALGDREWNRYPRLGSEELRGQIAGGLGRTSEELMVGNGSNEVLLAVMNALLQPGRKLVTIEPTFTLYKHYGEILGAEVITVPLSSEFEFQFDFLKRAVAKLDVSLTILCSPNNPTGSVIREDELRDLLEATGGYILVDEAYIDFSEQDFLPLLGDYPNLILTRTFSKAFAFAFGRFGYGIARPGLVEEIYKVLLPYNLSGFTEVAAEVLLQQRPRMQSVVDRIIEQREWLYGELKNLLELEVYPSRANFLLIKPSCDSNWLYRQFLERKILLRDVSYYPGLGNHLRITVGTEQENRRLVRDLTELLSENGTPIEK